LLRSCSFSHLLVILLLVLLHWLLPASSITTTSKIMATTATMNEEDLHRAARWGSSVEVKHMLDYRVFDTESRGYSSQTPLHDAATGGYLPVIKSLMEDYGADAEARDDRNRTPLFMAVKKGHFEIVQYLVESQRVSITAQDIFGATPLHIACSHWQVHIVKYLVQYRPSILRIQNHLGWTALHVAAREGHVGMLQVLLDYGGSSNSKSLLGSKTNIGLTPLHVALRTSSAPGVETVQLLLRQGSNLFAVDNHGQTALHLCNSKGIIACMLKQSISAVNCGGVDVGKILSIQNSRGETPSKRARRCAEEELSELTRIDKHALADYLESWQMRLAVPTKTNMGDSNSGKAKEQVAFEPSVVMNPKLSIFQMSVANKVNKILSDTLGVDALAVAILGYLTPLDVLARWDQWNGNSRCLLRADSDCKDEFVMDVEYKS
jgi:ankyrin repeat protein